MKLLKNKQGFTLIEIMMVVCVLSIFFAIIYNYLGFNFRYLDDRSDEHDYYLEARIAMGRIKQLLLNYNQLQVDVTAQTITATRLADDPNDEGELTDQLINFNKNTTDLTDFRYYLYCPACAGTGGLCTHTDHVYQIRSGGHVLVKGIKEFSVSLNDDNNVAELHIRVVNPNDSNDPGLVLNSGVRVYRKVVSN